jgi:hypothetical protein
MFETGFPPSLLDDVRVVSNVMEREMYNNLKYGESEQYIRYSLLDGENISFPYRIFNIEDTESKFIFSENQELIYHCIFSRSCNGFVRAKHIKAILDTDFPAWSIPYLLKISDEYVIEIIEIIYKTLQTKNTEEIKAIAVHNLQIFLQSHDRMISYWNEFYRNRCPKYKNYIGRALFHDCFGYSRRLERLRRISNTPLYTVN